MMRKMHAVDLDSRDRDDDAGSRSRLEDDALFVAPTLAKRAFDVAGGTALLFAFAPLAAVIAVLVKLDSRGPAMHTQLRVGLGGRPFRMYKFRSMRADAEALRETLTSSNEQTGHLFKIRSDPRVTRFGRWLRRSSLDELPQLLNILRGEMSLVGPRPLPVADLAELSSEYRPWAEERHKVLPGLTGEWQVDGRADSGFEQMVRFDLSYVRRNSLRRDLVLLLRTVPAVLRGRGAY
jgi:lipopolysaccharide/colanic/teichoic acid biosynthesis glycosyltransferase